MLIFFAKNKWGTLHSFFFWQKWHYYCGVQYVWKCSHQMTSLALTNWTQTSLSLASGSHLFVGSAYAPKKISISTQWAPNIKLTSHWHRCNVMTSHQCQYHVISTSCSLGMLWILMWGLLLLTAHYGELFLIIHKWVLQKGALLNFLADNPVWQE